MRVPLLRALASAGFATCALAFTSCAPSGFASETLIATVRVLAASAVPAYAQPGSQVNVQVLALDGRTSQPEPMKIYWLPRELLCTNPPDDAYYACFAGLQGKGDGGSPGGGTPAGLGLLQPGVDLTPFLPDAGPSFDFTMPADIVSSHTPVPGSPAPYGLAILFNVACAGHLQLLPVDPNNQNPQQVPLGCFDKNNNQLGPDDWVLGFTRVYAFEPDAGEDGGPITNENPVIASVDFQGSSLPVTLAPGMSQAYVAQGITVPVCTGKCSSVNIGPIVPQSSWELMNPTLVDVHGNPQHEQIWADFYSSFGSFSGEAGLLYDASSGSLGGPSTTDNQFTPPDKAGTGSIWIVVHDNRGGASWVTIPVTVQ
jgi:hypothetical protein